MTKERYYSNSESMMIRKDGSIDYNKKKIICRGKRESNFRDFVDEFNYILELDDDIIHNEFTGSFIAENIW